MTSLVDISNRALQSIGIQKVISTLAQDSAEAKSLNMIMGPTRRQLLRMAPWNCGLKTANLTYITSIPGTPENLSPGTTLWQPGQPAPPWAYEYQYPADCLRACWLPSATNTGYSGGTPITTAVTGGVSSYFGGRPVKFKVQTDTFVPVTAAAVVAGGTGAVVNDVITLPIGLTTSPPIGAPAQLLVTSVDGGGAITGISVVSSVINTSNSPSGNNEVIGGSYFKAQTGTIAQASTTGVGTGATFSLTFGPAAPQRVILTNQEFASMTYVQDVLDPNILDSEFVEAYVSVLAAQICISLKQDKALANMKIQEANAKISQARTADGNEGMTVNDVTPDWIRVRGYGSQGFNSGPFSDFDWGGLWSSYG